MRTAPKFGNCITEDSLHQSHKFRWRTNSEYQRTCSRLSCAAHIRTYQAYHKEPGVRLRVFLVATALVAAVSAVSTTTPVIGKGQPGTIAVVGRYDGDLYRLSAGHRDPGNLPVPREDFVEPLSWAISLRSLDTERAKKPHPATPRFCTAVPQRCARR